MHSVHSDVSFPSVTARGSKEAWGSIEEREPKILPSSSDAVQSRVRIQAERARTASIDQAEILRELQNDVDVVHPVPAVPAAAVQIEEAK